MIYLIFQITWRAILTLQLHKSFIMSNLISAYWVQTEFQVTQKVKA